MKKAFLWVLTLSLCACTVSPLGRRQFTMLPDSQVAMLGDQAFVELKQSMPIESDPRANAYVNCVADAITREIGGTWEVVLFRQQTPNAFALPGGKIGVHTGIFRVARNQDQLAAVLAHEVAHVLARHSNERMSQQLALRQGLGAIQAMTQPTSPTGQALLGILGLGAQYGVLMPYSRLQESEADLFGLDLMARAGFDPRQSVDLWVNMEQAGGSQPIEFLSTHPSHATRIQDLRQRMPMALELQRRANATGRKPQCDRERKDGGNP
ncbi:MAG TPA: M48 family metallopeptidase [Methylococcus sp.]|nr:M48 family metallopeptidase [Methylococcus sp.]